MDRASVYSMSVLAPDRDESEESNTQIMQQFRNFITVFRLDNAFIYRTQLQENILGKNYFLDVDIGHLINFDEELAHRLVNEPGSILPLFESAVHDCAVRISPSLAKAPDYSGCQVLLHSDANLISIRDLDSSYISKIVRIPGIIIGASTLSSKATQLSIKCRECGDTRQIAIPAGFAGLSLPRTCSSDKNDSGSRCPMDPYVVMHENSKFIDQQVLKLQEAPDQVPVGELPRHILLSADRYLANRVVPGSRCTVMGIFDIYQSKGGKGAGAAVAIRNPYIRLVGIQTEVDHASKGNIVFSEEEEQEFLEMARNPNLYESFANSIAPSIYGSKDIKKAITLLLFGGSKKILPDGMKLRGDINVLLLGDPGTAKSQLLKFVEKVAPIAIYTSGKGSSAAGLTASVQRDAGSGEFYLEGGAMVLADGGVVCIDEFDKMREEDRVAIHEAMEQQTISIAKAGITTILNARSSVLAAANPIFGRYNAEKAPGENIDFATSVLSRFDAIFIVKDEHNADRDMTIARHVMSTQMGKITAQEEDDASGMGEFSLAKMKRYIQYCRTRCAPRLSEEAAEKLSSQFVAIRKRVQEAEHASDERSTIPITVRQLEAIIRMAEARAKINLSPVATEEHVDEAIRLFMGSTMEAVIHGQQAGKELKDEMNKIEAELVRRLPVGWNTSFYTLKKELVVNKGYSEAALSRALQSMNARGVITFAQGMSKVVRTGV